MTMPQSPSFQKPPVVEVVLGIQFDPLPIFTNVQLGLFWSILGIDQWTIAEDLPPLPQQFERFGNERQWSQVGTISFGLAQIPSSRARFTKDTRNRVIQLQNGRFWYHWVSAGESEYPRYDKIRSEMSDLFARLVQFLQQNHLGEIHLNQWEISYTNRIPRGTVWEQPSDWTKLFNSNAMLPAKVGNNQLENFSGTWQYEIPPSRGRLHVDLRSAKDKPDGDDILMLNLTARGPIAESSAGTDNAIAGLDLGHENIVYAFRDLTSSEARKFWGEIT
jgi:uncharacterized protein (TIGR04255 family)